MSFDGCSVAKSIVIVYFLVVDGDSFLSDVERRNLQSFDRILNVLGVCKKVHCKKTVACV